MGNDLELLFGLVILGLAENKSSIFRFSADPLALAAGSATSLKSVDVVSNVMGSESLSSRLIILVPKIDKVDVAIFFDGDIFS